MTHTDPRRTYAPPEREPWQEPIRWISRAIDQHTAEHIRTGNLWHAQQAQVLRDYLTSLKQWIFRQS